MRSRMHDRSLIAMDRSQWETQRENGSAADVIFHCHAAAVRFHDFLDDRQTQACSFSFAILSPPESLEETLPVFCRDAASLIYHGYTTVSMDPHRNLPVRRRVGYGIFDKVPDGILYSICIRFDPDRSVGADEGDCPALGDRPWRYGCDHRARDLVQIDRLELEGDCIETSHPQQLLDQPVHACDIRPQLAELSVALHGIQSAGDNSERSAQLMRSVCGELALREKSPLQSIKRMIDRVDQRLDLRRQVCSGQPDGCGARADSRR